MLVFNADLHFFQAVADVGGIQFINTNRLGIIWLNSHHRDTLVAVIQSESLDALLVHLGNGAMIASKYDDKHCAGRIVRQTVCFSVYARQRKVWRRPTNRQNWMAVLRPGTDSNPQSSKKSQTGSPTPFALQNQPYL